MKNRALKEKDLASLREEFSASKTAFVVQFQGLKVVDVDDLRRKVRIAKGRYRVVQNTLARKATEGTSLAGLAGSFVGPTAVVLADAEPAGVAKVLADFSKTNQAVSVKAGLVDGAVLDAEQCKALAEVPSKEVLRAKLVGLLASPLQRTVRVLAGPPRSLAIVLSEGAKKKGGEG